MSGNLSKGIPVDSPQMDTRPRHRQRREPILSQVLEFIDYDAEYRKLLRNRIVLRLRRRPLKEDAMTEPNQLELPGGTQNDPD
ncbi:hypothetical protein MHAE_04385 [Mycobacterium haemophilum DSM 44634]|uniref:hypothetical protein n=1 Tax=Mycobacterium haemophilum TaxID=29311 RepID=UPI00065636B4|nr:hypothetical protein [Mycobacterium haemophilum]AKN17473.1 hypothetical protein B586_14260 [Mycobacterium haemophilum DSM 44634]MCV7341596.1 hypothetical protein [Mycobacterium haemophilum DSM 44634]